MSDAPKFFWSPPDRAPIVGVTIFEGIVVIATRNGIYVITPEGGYAPPEWTIYKISNAVKNDTKL